MDAASAPRHRFPVDLDADPAALDERIDRMLRVLPTGSADRADLFGFSFRREPDALSAIAVGPMLGTAILLAEYSRRLPFLSLVGPGLSTIFFGIALWLAWRFIRNALARVEILADGDELVVRSRLGQRTTETRRFDARQIVAVLVVQAEGEAPRVLLGGPRHAVVGEVFRTRHLDPERLAPWMAEMIALVARRASLALRP